jgi:hypothetical protein
MAGILARSEALAVNVISSKEERAIDEGLHLFHQQCDTVLISFHSYTITSNQILLRIHNIDIIQHSQLCSLIGKVYRPFSFADPTCIL